MTGRLLVRCEQAVAHVAARSSGGRSSRGGRGPESVELGLAIAQNGLLTPQLLDLADAPPQVVKHLWHHLARYGR